LFRPSQRFFTFVFISLFLAPLAASSLTLQEICFECTRYELKGVYKVSVRPFISDLNILPARLLGHSGMDKESRQFLTLSERLFPEKIGVLDASFNQNDCDISISGSPDWVDRAILRSSAKSREEMDNPLGRDILAELDNQSTEPLMEGEGEEREEIPELTYTDREGRLRRFNYGVEDFSVSELDGKRYLVDVADKEIIRRTYDEKMRLLQKEYFPVASSSKKIALRSSSLYSYEEDSVIPKSLQEENLEKNTKTLSTFSPSGKQLSCEQWHFEPAEETEGEGEKPKIEKIDEKQLWTYDESDRLISEEKTQWSYSKDDRGKDVAEKSAFIWTYSYGELSSRPDTDFFEDGKLRVKTVYTGENQYTETLYFDGGYEVSADYVDGVKIQEVISLDGQEVRRNSFEQ